MTKRSTSISAFGRRMIRHLLPLLLDLPITADSALRPFFPDYLKHVELFIAPVPPRVVFVFLGYVGIIWAAYLVWRDEAREVIELARHAEPYFKGFPYGFDFADVSYEKDFSGIEIRIQIDIRNLGAPSVVTSWRLYLEMPDGKSKQFGETLSRPDFRDLQHTISTAEMVSEAPIIPSGGQHTFNLRFHAPKSDRELIIGNGKTWRLVYSDIMGKEYTNTYRS